jgi:hypothetical protein
MATWDVTTANSSLEFDTQNDTYNSCYQIDSNHFINFWLGGAATTDGFVQVFTVNTSTWAVTTANSSLQFDTDVGSYNSCYQIDSNHFINFWSGSGADGFVQVFTVNTTTWAVTTANSSLEFDTQNYYGGSTVAIDSNHFLLIWFGGASYHSYAQVFTVNTTTWAVTTANSSLEIDTQSGGSVNCLKIDSNHFITFWTGYSAIYDNTGVTQIIAVDTTTWAVTTAGSQLVFDNRLHQYDSSAMIDTNHFIHIWSGYSGGYKSMAAIFEVNTSTWAISNYASLNLGAILNHNSCVIIDTNHVINFYQDSTSGDGFTQSYTVNTSTWAVTTSASSLEFDTQDAAYNTSYKIDSNHFINFWAGPGSDGFVQVFSVEMVTSAIKTINSLAKASIKTVNGLAIANVKTWNGLA